MVRSAVPRSPSWAWSRCLRSGRLQTRRARPAAVAAKALISAGPRISGPDAYFVFHTCGRVSDKNVTHIVIWLRTLFGCAFTVTIQADS
jgi:hypothetical protein